jgi:hypothetical protein
VCIHLLEFPFDREKLAALVGNEGNDDGGKAREEVYERAVKAVLSCDLWQTYCSTATEESGNFLSVHDSIMDTDRFPTLIQLQLLELCTL